MTDNYNDVLQRAIDDTFYPWLHQFVIQRLKRDYPNRWWDAGVITSFGFSTQTHRDLERLDGPFDQRAEGLDVYALLSIISDKRKNFPDLSEDAYVYVGELRRHRNRLSHRNKRSNKPFTIEEAQRALDTISLLLESLSAHPEAEAIDIFTKSLLRIRYLSITESPANITPKHHLNSLTAGLSGLPGNQVRNVQAFLDEYLGPPTNPIVFGGRQEQLDTLDRWLSDPAQPYALMVAPAGRGKSALLTHWVAQIAQQSARVHVAFLPISLRFNTASKSAALGILGARLYHLHSVTTERPQDAELWSEEITRYLDDDRPAEAPTLVIVIDGADEAIGWELGRDLRFPVQPGRGVKVLISARTMADCDERGWLRRLGWEKYGQLLALSLLDRASVADVLHSVGGYFATPDTTSDLTAELFRLSEGDPLLLQLYVAALRDQAKQTAFITPVELRKLRPGLDAYFERWWEDQRRQWGHNSPLREPAVRHMLNLLACALGPLMLDDVLELGSQDQIDTLTIEEALHGLARFVIGDGKAQGYVFNHPRLGQYFYEKLSTRDRTAYEERFLSYGKRALAQLNQTPIDKRQLVSAYIMRTYRVHLDRAGAEDEQFYALISEGWLRGWESIEGVYDGFLNDMLTLRSQESDDRVNYWNDGQRTI